MLKINNNGIFKIPNIKDLAQSEKKAKPNPEQPPQVKNTNAFYHPVSFQGLGARKTQAANIINILKNKITNFELISENSARGESLSSKTNRKFIKFVKKMGVKTVVDLRAKFGSAKYPELCQKNGIKYFNIPIDANSVPDEEIIKKLPEFFDVMNNNKFYISCAQGLHRTDIALSLNYLFNPKAQQVPKLVGHIRGNTVKVDDIFARTNSLLKKFTPEDKAKMAWDEAFEANFKTRKKMLVSAQMGYFPNLAQKSTPANI